MPFSPYYCNYIDDDVLDRQTCLGCISLDQEKNTVLGQIVPVYNKPERTSSAGCISFKFFVEHPSPILFTSCPYLAHCIFPALKHSSHLASTRFLNGAAQGWSESQKQADGCLMNLGYLTWVLVVRCQTVMYLSQFPFLPFSGGSYSLTLSFVFEISEDNEGKFFLNTQGSSLALPSWPQQSAALLLCLQIHLLSLRVAQNPQITGSVKLKRPCWKQP